MKRILSIFFAVVFMFSFAAEAFAVNGDVLVYENTEHNVKTYRNVETEEMHANFSLENASVGDEIVLYENEETGEIVSVIYEAYEPAMSPRISGNSGWSGGYLPSGNTTMTVSVTNTTGIKVAYKVDISAYPVYFIAARAPVITGRGMTAHSYTNPVVIYSEATNTRTALAEMTFNISYTQGGYNPGAMVGHLTFEANVMGQFITSWEY